MSSRNPVLDQSWQPSFRHSAGRLGSHFIRACRSGRLLGWKTQRLGVTVPPVETGEPGEWVEVGPGATLVGYATARELAPGGIEPGKVFAAVKLDGADSLLYALVTCANPASLRPGTRLKARFASDSDAGPFLPSFELLAVA